MQQAIEQRIRVRAYQIWEAVGRPEGHSDQHWLAAERELLAACVEPMIRSAVSKQPASRKSKPQAKPARTRARKIA